MNYFDKPVTPDPPDPDDPDDPDDDDDDDDPETVEGMAGLRVTDHAYEWNDEEKKWERLGVIIRRRIPLYGEDDGDDDD